MTNRKAIRRARRIRRTVLTVCLMALVAVLSIGATVAYLTDESEVINNTFTAGDIEITLEETTGNTYKMVPGNTIAKDPKVTVDPESEACYLFVKLVKSNNYDTYLEPYTLAAGWKALDETNEPGVYVRTVDATTAKNGVSYYVLGSKTDYAKGYVEVKTGVTTDQLETAETNGPSLKIKAFAVQFDNVEDEDAAWELIDAAEKTF